jgi:hypothetical protein
LVSLALLFARVVVLNTTEIQVVMVTMRTFLIRRVGAILNLGIAAIFCDVFGALCRLADPV